MRRPFALDIGLVRVPGAVRSMLLVAVLVSVSTVHGAPPAPELTARVESSLGSFAKRLEARPPDPSSMHDLLTGYLNRTDEVFGSAFAFAPVEKGGKPFTAVPYVYRKNGRLVRKDLAAMGGDYVSAEWYAKPVREKRPCWSKPYFDKEGGEIDMVTYSIPIYSKGVPPRLVGVVTADLPVESLRKGH